MNLRKAIKSGRPFRRKGNKYWYLVYNGDIVWIGNSTYLRRSFGHKIEDDIKADDFELKDIEYPTKYIKERKWGILQNFVESLNLINH